MNRLLRTAWLYNRRVLPRISGLRGASRFSKYLESLALSKITIGDGKSVEINGDTVSFRHKTDMKYFIKEYPVVNKFIECLSSAEKFCDVGGYHGFYSVIASSSCDVSCFEMDPKCGRVITENMKLNGCGWEVVQKPVWSEREKLDFQASGSGTDSVGSGEETRRATTLDHYFRYETQPDVIKIDVEGAELRVLKGADETLNGGPDILVELHGNERMSIYGDSEEELVEFLEGRGYRLQIIDERGGERHVLAKSS